MTLAAVALAASFILFVGYGIDAYRRNRSSDQFFHVPGVRENIATLVTANVTLGTGLAYLLTAGSLNGVLMLSLPLGVFVGYALLVKFMQMLPPPIIDRGGNLLLAYRDTIENDRAAAGIAGRSWFDIAVVGPLIIVYLLVFAYEIFVSSQLIAAVVAPGSGPGTAHIVAGLMFITALIYCTLGGMQAVSRAAAVQLVGIVGFLALIVYAGLSLKSTSTAAAAAAQVDGQRLINSSIGLVDAIATQFYSLINVFNASHMRREQDRSRVFRSNGIILAAILGLVILIGAAAPADLAKDTAGFVSKLATTVAAIPVVGPLLLAILVFGMVSVVLSTAATIIVAVTYFIHGNILRQPSEVDVAISRVRKLMVGLFAVAFCFLAGLFAMSPNIFYLLLAIASGPVVFAPFVVTCGLLARRPGAMAGVTNAWLLLFLLLFASAATASFTILPRVPQLVPYMSLLHLVLSTVACMMLYRVALARAPQSS